MEGSIFTDSARAKVNLTLRVLGRRADGYHELDSLVAFAEFCDDVALSSASWPLVTLSGPFGAAIEGVNLAQRALDLVAARAPQLRLGCISIEKHLPIAAGLGGGSADAAAALRLIKHSNGAAAEGVDWLELATLLGSDVPVCFVNSACRMTGRGEILAPITTLQTLAAVLVNPQVQVPADKTRQVFQRLAAPALNARQADLTTLTDNSGVAWLDLIANSRNDLEGPATLVVPAIAEVLTTLRDHPLTQIARLSGAGPTCFALTATMADADTLARSISAQQPSWWVRATRIG